MRAARFLGFLFQFTTLGLAAAFVIVFLKPELLQGPRPVVEIRQQTGAAGSGKEAPATSDHLQSAPLSFTAAVEKASPTVVNVYSVRVVGPPSARSNNPMPPRRPDQARPPRQVETGLGSGVIFSPQGYVLTNDHVIADADEIQVMLVDGRSAEAQVVGTDPETDLAVLKIDLPDLPAIALGDSRGLKVGNVVLAIGNPYGVGQTVTLGIVSATGRRHLGLSTYENFIQTDAAINPGNSGGALVNTNGELVGLNTAIFSRSGGSQGIGFAIPAALAKRVMTEIIERGRVIRGWIGIGMDDVSPELAKRAGLKSASGVVVISLLEGSPAAEAGLQAGDVLTRLNRQDISDTRHMLDLVARQHPDTRVVVEGVRDGKPFSMETRVAERPRMTQRP